MSLPEPPASTHATNGTPPPLPEREVTGQRAPALPASQIDLLKAELRRVRIELDKTKVQLFHSRIWHQSETRSRQTFQQGLEVNQRICLQLGEKYQSIYEECDREKISLQEDLRIARELIASQKQLIELYQGQPQQQQQLLLPASHLVQRGPLLSQCNDHNHSCQYSPYQSSGNDEFIGSAGLGPHSGFDYSIGFPPEGSYDTGPVMSTPVTELEKQTPNLSIHSIPHPISFENSGAEPLSSTPLAEFENQTHNLSIQSILHPISAERVFTGPTHDKETKGPEDEGVKPSKKRKIK